MCRTQLTIVNVFAVSVSQSLFLSVYLLRDSCIKLWMMKFRILECAAMAEHVSVTLVNALLKKQMYHV